MRGARCRGTVLVEATMVETDLPWVSYVFPLVDR